MFYVDNQPAYSRHGPDLKEVGLEVIAKGEVVYTDEHDMCDPTRQTFLLRIVSAKGNLTAEDVAQLIDRGMSPAPCHCEHDCCGHRHGDADVRLFGFDRAEVTVYTMRNF